MSAATYNFICEQGATFRRTIGLSVSGTTVDLTNYTAYMQVRTGGPGGTIILDLSTSSGISHSSQALQVLVSATATAALTAGQYYYDFFINAPSGGDITRLLQGAFVVIPRVTVEP